MDITFFLKKNFDNIPPGVGKILNKIPYENRPGLGKIYRRRKRELSDVERFNMLQKQEFVFRKMRNLLDRTYNTIPFYRSFYDEHGFRPEDFKSFNDILKLPVVTKSILQKWELNERSSRIKGRYIVNTGGSSGTPFSFYILPDSMGHEWAHMHTIWSRLEYKPSDLKLVFSGRSDLKRVVDYDAVRNHFAVDIYADYELVAKELKKTLRKHRITYLHGYPSSIYDFALYCQNADPELKGMLSANLKGAFLGSEYPHKQYRKVIEDVFDIETVSWYGHTERAVLAYERQKQFVYEPFLTYGFAEAVENSEGEYELLATSYYNYASPLIRYNTGDIISNVKTRNGIMESFEVIKGREGEFVIDKNGKKINLTALIFGRHHELFNKSQFIQVKQLEPGFIEIHYVSQEVDIAHASQLFDTRNLNFDIRFLKRTEPERTKAGKVNLLIK